MQIRVRSRRTETERSMRLRKCYNNKTSRLVPRLTVFHAGNLNLELRERGNSPKGPTTKSPQIPESIDCCQTLAMNCVLQCYILVTWKQTMSAIYDFCQKDRQLSKLHAWLAGTPTVLSSGDDMLIPGCTFHSWATDALIDKAVLSTVRACACLGTFVGTHAWGNSYLPRVPRYSAE